MHDDDRDLLGPTEGDPPSPEFVEELWERLDAAWESRDDTARTGPSPTAIDAAVLDERDQEMGKNRLWGIFAAAAAIVIVIGGLVMISDRDDDVADTASGQPEPAPAQPAPGATEPAPEETAPPATEPAPEETAPPTTEPPGEWSFEFTYIEVGSNGPVVADEEYAWVARNDAPQLDTIDLATNMVVSTAEIPPGARYLNHGFGSVWIGHLDGTISRFDPITSSIVATIDVGAAGWIQPGPDAVWVAARREVVRIDPATNQIASRIDVGATAGAVGVNDDGVWVRVGNTVHRIDPDTDLVVASIEVPSSGGAFIAGEEGVWASGTRSVYRIDPIDNTVTTVNVVEAGEGTLGGIHVGGGSVWIRFKCGSESCTGGVARIDPETNTVVAKTNLRDGWQPTGGMNTGPTTAWTFNPDAIARIDF